MNFTLIQLITTVVLPIARGAARVMVGDAAPSAGKDAAARACIVGGYVATRVADGKSVRFKRMK